MRIDLMFGFVGVALGLVGVVRGGEWKTSRGEFCIDECKYRGDTNYFYWCHTVDGMSKVYRPSGHQDFFQFDKRGIQVDMNKRWDYCTPQHERLDLEEVGEVDFSQLKNKPAQDCFENGVNTQGRQQIGGPTKVNSWADCAKKCAQNANCTQWTWAHVGPYALNCAIMSGFGSKVSDSNTISGSRECQGPPGKEGGSWGTNGWNNQGNQGGNRGNQGGHNEGNNEMLGVARTSLYHQTDCLGRCYNSGGRSICDTKTDHPLAQGSRGNRWFYCSPNEPLLRKQISAEKRLWCISPCSRIRGETDYTCSTMFGRDKCSPAPGKSSKGKKCIGPCQLNDSFFKTYYFCYLDAKQANYETCGYHDVDQELKQRLEFTESSTTPSVCADKCQWNDPEEKDYKFCNIVKWDWNSTTRESTLMKSWTYCEGFYAPPTSGSTIAIVIGSIVGVIVILVVISASIRKATTTDSA